MEAGPCLTITCWVTKSNHLQEHWASGTYDWSLYYMDHSVSMAAWLWSNKDKVEASCAHMTTICDFLSQLLTSKVNENDGRL